MSMGSASCASAAAVANAFLDCQERDNGSFPRIDPMKLQKLLFYAKAWCLASDKGPLFDEEVYAWPWGPVVPSIYGTFRSFGSRPIVGVRATEMVRVKPGVLGYVFREPPSLPEEVRSFVQTVWESHKPFTGIQLSNATHSPGEPWTIVKEQYGSLDQKPVIPNELIEAVFKSKISAPV